MAGTFTFKNFLNKKKRIYAISIEILEASTQIYGNLIIEEENQEFTIENSFLNETLEEFFTTADVDIPIILNISGVGITTRLVEHQQGYLQKILFKANIQDFYIYDKIHEQNVLVSFCRRKTLDHYFELFKGKGFFVLHISLGPGSLVDLLPFSGGKSITTPGFRLILDADNNLDLQRLEIPVEEEIIIEGEKILTNFTIGLADYLNFKRGSKGIPEFEETGKYNLEEVKFKYWLKKAIPILALFVLAITLLGHIWKQSLIDELSQNQEELTEIENRNLEVINLTTELRQKEEILKNSGFKSFGFFSKHISLLTQEIPDAILLDKLEVQPVPAKYNNEDVIAIEPDRILLEGDSIDDEIFKNWIRSFEKYPWIKSIQILDYARKTDRLNEFVVEIKI